MISRGSAVRVAKATTRGRNAGLPVGTLARVRWTGEGSFGDIAYLDVSEDARAASWAQAHGFEPECVKYVPVDKLAVVAAVDEDAGGTNGEPAAPAAEPCESCTTLALEVVAFRAALSRAAVAVAAELPDLAVPADEGDAVEVARAVAVEAARASAPPLRAPAPRDGRRPAFNLDSLDALL